MKVSFRQGLVRTPAGFLAVSGSNVNLVVPSTDSVIVNFADGTSNYLLTERVTINSAWTGVTPATDQWLYWDIDVTTGARTFGITLVQPSHGNTAPASPVNDKHWFDTQTNTMKVWNSTAGRWVRRIRVFACKLAGGSSVVSVSINAPAFGGTQVGLTGSYTAGAIVFDADGGKPLKRTNGTFFTTEDQAFTQIASASQVKFGSLVIPATAGENIPAYAVVRFTDYNKVVIATAYTVGTGAYGIVESGLTTGDTTNVVLEGVVTNPTWDFTIVGAGLGDEVRFPRALEVNSPLYIDTLGYLTSIRPTVPVVVAAVVDKSTILIRPSSLSTIFSESTVDPATTTNLGMVTLSVASATPLSPIVVGDNDPRLTPALDDLTDVNAPTPINGDVLTYDNGTGQWISAAPAGGGSTTLAGLTDVAVDLSVSGPIAELGAVTGGSGYVDGFYDSVPLTGGTGTNASVNLQVSGGAVTSITFISWGGSNYNVGDVLSASNTYLGGTGAGFQVPVTSVSPKSENAILRWEHTTGKWINQDGIPHEIPLSFSLLAPLPTPGDTFTGAGGLVLAEYIAPVDMVLYRYTPGSRFVVNHSNFGTPSNKYTPLIFSLYLADPIGTEQDENSLTFNQVGEIVRARSGTATIDHTFCSLFGQHDLIIRQGSILRLVLDTTQDAILDEMSSTGNFDYPDFLTGAITLVAVTKKITPPQKIATPTVIVNTNPGGGLDGGSGALQWNITSETSSTFNVSMEFFITNWNALLTAGRFDRLYEIAFDVDGTGGGSTINDTLATIGLNDGSPSYAGVTGNLFFSSFYIWSHGLKFTYDGTPLTSGTYNVTFKLYDYGSSSALLGTCSFGVEVFPGV